MNREIPMHLRHRLTLLSLMIILLLAGNAAPCVAQPDPVLEVRNVSTDRTAMVLLSWHNPVLASWSALRVERSSDDSVWQVVTTVRPPAESVLDDGVESGAIWHYRAVRRMEDQSEQVEWGDTVTVLPDVAVDLLEYLLPNPRVGLHYRYVAYKQAHYFQRENTISFRPMVPEIRSDHEHAFPFRKIIDSSSGSSDTSLCEIRCLYDSIPRLVIDDVSYGWLPLQLLTRIGTPNLDNDREVSIGLKERRPWRAQRFIENDSVWESSDREFLHVGLRYNGGAYIESASIILKRDLGVQGIADGIDGVGMPVHDLDTLSLQSVTAMRSVTPPAIFTLTSVWPHPVTSTASIAVELERPAALAVSAFDALGRQVATLTDGYHEPGRHILHFDASRLPRGLYFIRAICGDEARTIKVLIR